MRFFSLSENRRAVESTVDILNDSEKPEGGYWLPVLGTRLESLKTIRGMHAFRKLLTAVISEWLRCGRHVLPENALTLGSVSKPELEPRSFWQNGKVVRGKPLDKSDPAYNSWLWRVYLDFLQRVPPNVQFERDGELIFSYGSVSSRSAAPPNVLPPMLEPDSPDLAVWEDVMLWFVLLLNSGHAQLLDCCTYCHQFFTREREMRSGQIYKRGGPTCPRCKGTGAKARTSARRGDARDRMLRVAAEAWATWKKTSRVPDRHEAVAAAVNANCGDEIMITTQRARIGPVWVSRNEKDIVRMAGEQKDGKR